MNNLHNSIWKEKINGKRCEKYRTIDIEEARSIINHSGNLKRILLDKWADSLVLNNYINVTKSTYLRLRKEGPDGFLQDILDIYFEEEPLVNSEDILRVNENRASELFWDSKYIGEITNRTSGSLKDKCIYLPVKSGMEYYLENDSFGITCLRARKIK